ncbi:hypothetical protein ACP70R_013519 [Stipagrostis hirtigluma subsp. patula]
MGDRRDAVDAVPLDNQVRTIIRIAPGVHRQPLYIPKSKNFITLCGSPIKDTVISWDNKATRIQHTQVVPHGTGTFGDATVIVEGDDFIAENIIFRNSAPQVSGQALSVRVTADRCAFYNCQFLGCAHALVTPGVSQHGRRSSSESTAFVFFKCVITGNGEAAYMYLGRPWEPFGRVVFAETFMDRCIEPAGWHNWDKTENEKTACFYEYRCSGPGSSTSQRVAWCRELDGDEAIPFLIQTFIDPDFESPWLVHKLGTELPSSA